MSKPSIVSTTVALSAMAALLLGCPKRNDDNDKPATKATATAKPPPPAPPPPPPPPRADVPFQGKYTKYAEATWKNGRRVSVSNANGAASLNIESGKVTYDQVYTVRGKKNRVIQVYTFTPDAVKPVGNAGYDVALVFQSISGDTQSYSPDKNKPKIEARKQASGWEIGLLTTDNNGIMGGVEFK
ncbi:MAG: hypothetical protein QM820_23080 [Minicystis sp.]